VLARGLLPFALAYCLSISSGLMEETGWGCIGMVPRGERGGAPKEVPRGDPGTCAGVGGACGVKRKSSLDLFALLPPERMRERAGAMSILLMSSLESATGPLA